MNQVSNVLKSQGEQKKGDWVAIDVHSLSTQCCARIGAVHSVLVFAGFSAEALATRIKEKFSSLSAHSGFVANQVSY